MIIYIIMLIVALLLDAKQLKETNDKHITRVYSVIVIFVLVVGILYYLDLFNITIAEVFFRIAGKG